jgi:hypothetical protein
MKSQPINGLGPCFIYRHTNTQKARHVGALGAVRRALPLVRLSRALSSLLARIAQHRVAPPEDRKLLLKLRFCTVYAFFAEAGSPKFTNVLNWPQNTRLRQHPARS